MIILVPETIKAELLAATTGLQSVVELAFYAEDGPAPAALAEAEAIFRWVGGKRFSQLVADAPRLRWLHTASAGVDHVFTPEVLAQAESGALALSDSGPAFGPAISEWVLMMMLAAARHLPEQQEHQRNRSWQAVKGQREIFGATVGIVGLGPIGRAVAERAKAFGMRVVGLRRSPQPVDSVDEVLTGSAGLETLIAASDYVVLAAALTGETHHLIGAEQLARIKPDAWLINIARGGMVDESALIQALQSGQIAGAALDVFAAEPLQADSPLWGMPNVLISPHNSGGWTPGLRARQLAIFVENLRRFAKGEALENVVDIARGY